MITTVSCGKGNNTNEKKNMNKNNKNEEYYK